jgi:hypothetical protein
MPLVSPQLDRAMLPFLRNSVSQDLSATRPMVQRDTKGVPQLRVYQFPPIECLMNKLPEWLRVNPVGE